MLAEPAPERCIPNLYKDMFLDSYGSSSSSRFIAFLTQQRLHDGGFGVGWLSQEGVLVWQGGVHCSLNESTGCEKVKVILHDEPSTAFVCDSILSLLEIVTTACVSQEYSVTDQGQRTPVVFQRYAST